MKFWDLSAEFIWVWCRFLAQNKELSGYSETLENLYQNKRRHILETLFFVGMDVTTSVLMNLALQ
jgi:hypothetical protein